MRSAGLLDAFRWRPRVLPALRSLLGQFFKLPRGIIDLRFHFGKTGQNLLEGRWRAEEHRPHVKVVLPQFADDPIARCQPQVPGRAVS